MECTPKTNDCAICTFVCYHEQVVCDSLRFVKDKNKCMAVLLKLSTSLTDLYPARNSMATTAAETTALVTKELMGLLGVGLEKILCIRACWGSCPSCSPVTLLTAKEWLGRVLDKLQKDWQGCQ